MKRIYIAALMIVLAANAHAGPWFSGGSGVSSYNDLTDKPTLATDSCTSGNICKKTNSTTIGDATSNTDYLPPTNPQAIIGSSLATSGYSGLSIPGTSLTAGSVYYFGASGLALAKADSATTMGGVCIAVSTTACTVIGVYRYASTQSWTVGGSIYVSGASAGALTQTAPSTSGHIVQKVGKALAADTILFLPSLDLGTVQ